MSNTGNVNLLTLHVRKIMVAPVGTAIPTLARPMNWSGSGWVECGYFDGDVGLATTEPRIGYKPHGASGNVVERVVGKSVEFSIALGETDLAHMKYAFPSAVESGNTLKDGGTVTNIAYLAWALETPNGVMQIKKASASGEVDFNIADDDFTKMPLTVVGVELDTDPPDERLWKWHDFFKAGLIV